MRLSKIILFIGLFAAALAVSAVALQEQQIQLSEKLIRLHVVANSDEPEDQQIKLKVRDAVLAVTEPLLQDAGSPEKALHENLSLIQNAAQECLRANGCSHSVQVSLAMEQFPTRYYESFALPAGIYRSLRVTIGQGQGHNWWCVVFPSICMRSASEWNAVAASAGLLDEEIGLISGKSGKYVLKFKLLELVQKLQCRIVNMP